MYEDGFQPGIMKVCAWSGVVFCLMWLIGASVVAGWQYIPPPSAADPAIKVAADYASKNLGIQIGVTLANFSIVAYTMWGMVVTQMTRRVEKDWPILYFVQVVSLAVCVIVILMIALFWGAASWRAGDTLPEVTQLANDLGWLGVLYTGAPFAAYMVPLGLVTLADKSENPVYPRWSAYFNFFVSFFMFEAAGILFFKTGPFSQNGIFVFWIPMFVFFSWIVTFSVLAAKAVNAEVDRRKRAS